jgi:hypothetical protein
MSSLPFFSTLPRKAWDPDRPSDAGMEATGRAWSTSAVRARWSRRHTLAAGLRAGRGLAVLGDRRGSGGPPVTVSRRVLEAVPFPSASGWAGRAAGNGAAASPDGLWLTASRCGAGHATSGAAARNLPMRERTTGGAVASPGICRRRGAGAGAAQRRVGDGAAR